MYQYGSTVLNPQVECRILRKRRESDVSGGQAGLPVSPLDTEKVGAQNAGGRSVDTGRRGPVLCLNSFFSNLLRYERQG